MSGLETVLEWELESGLETAVEVLELGTLFQEDPEAKLETAFELVELETVEMAFEVLESGT